MQGDNTCVGLESLNPKRQDSRAYKPRAWRKASSQARDTARNRAPRREGLQETHWQIPNHTENGEVRASGKESWLNIYFTQSKGGLVLKRILAFLF